MISRVLASLQKARSFRSLSLGPSRRLNIFAGRGGAQEAELPASLREAKEFSFGQAEIRNPVHELVVAGKERLVGSWLLLTAGTVFFMVVLGGYTRLSGSGLSMTRWKPIDARMPATREKWEEEFEHYKQFPEYQLVNRGMDVEGFKKIFFVEWLHRFVGSSLGVVFGLPFAYFAARGYLKAPMVRRLGALLLLGASQGAIGWWMVKSGMQQKPEYQSKPRVSVYRLFVHLNNAVLIYSGLLWNALTLLRKPQESLLRPQNLLATKSMRAKGILLVHLVALNIMSGACAAGIDAMKVFNDWPLYNGSLFPPNMLEKHPLWKNFFENKGLVQFNHRNLGYLTTLYTLLMLYQSRNLTLMRNQRVASLLVGGAVALQIANGILTLRHNTPAHEANVHQMNALLVLTSTLYLLHTCRRPSPLFARYLLKFVK